ncbi:deaminase [Saccharomonospora piscinae]|uniref:Deaminase n=1 Tax=Saccharomonospora piscinae TaxID=687388 RepID=A0A1V9A6L2_SACPI|nr:dihydrofolate reductase family protein [Saccharomonospora piscinae]OQO92775.1 deaminase [Saccharomonospora piscinae]
MSIVTADLAISLDGFIAGPNITADNPVGDRGIELHEWFAGLASWRERQNLSGGVDNTDSRILGAWFDGTGAVVMGRTMFDTGELPWGENPPFRAPVFVLTNRPRPVLEKAGGTSFTFVSDGIESALKQAREAAGDRNVDIAGGAQTVRQYLRAGLIDELQLHVVPILLGAGVPLFDGIGSDMPSLEQVRVVEGESAAHLTYRVIR